MSKQQPLTVLPEPCLTCPYRKDVPSGVWAMEEYEKLRLYASNEAFGVFLCHQSAVAGHDIACKGWVIVEAGSVACRLAQLNGKLLPAAFTDTTCELHESGNAAADYGERALKRPGKKARKLIDKLKKTGRFEG